MPERTMPETTLPLRALLRAAGLDPGEQPPTDELLQQIDELHQSALSNPQDAVLRWLRLYKRATDAESACVRTAEAVEKLREILTLLTKNAILHRLEGLDLSDETQPLALCRVGGELRLISLHPELDVDELRALEPWEFVRVGKGGADELLVLGTYRSAGLRDSSLGSIVEFKGYHDKERGQVRVARQGDDEQIVNLCPELRDAELVPMMKLILMKDDPRWAIAAAPVARAESRFEMSIDRIQTKLSDLAGLDPILEPMIKDILLRVVRTDLRDSFDLEPLGGIIVYSSQPGAGKTSLVRGVARWLHETGEAQGFDVVLYVVPPGGLKNKYHGEDARLVREDLCGAIRARQAVPRERPLFQLVVLDEIDSLGRRSGGDDGSTVLSAAQNDAVQALLAEMDGVEQNAPSGDNPPAHVLWVGLTNRPDLVDEALKRPGRFDLLLEVPPTTIEAAEGILAVYAKSQRIPWAVGEEIERGLSEDDIRERFLRPALRGVFDAVALRYFTDARQGVEVGAGELLTGACYKNAMNAAKDKAATRRLFDSGVPAVTFDDVVDGLLDQAANQARNMEADHRMLARQLRLKVPVTRVELVHADELSGHRFRRTDTGREES